MRKLLAALVVVGFALLVLKWVLITAAVLAVPFAAWWLWDRRHRASPGDRVTR